MVKIAEYFGARVDYLLGVGERADPSDEVIMFPVLIGVSAGFDHAMEEIDNGDLQPVPSSLVKGGGQDDYCVFLVEGDSMSPKFLDGDRVLVRKQTSVDSGNIAIVAYDDYENGTIKKVNYEHGCDYVDLIPINPKYRPVRIQGYDLEGVRVIGKVIYLFREI
jgi:repressor LexA